MKKNRENNQFKTLQIIALLLVFLISGCAAPVGHHVAFSDKTALAGNSRQFDLTLSQAMRATKQALLHQGFLIDSMDAGSGLIKASRTLQDPNKPEQSYGINVSTYVFENGPQTTTITLSASQQTVLHRKLKTWWRLIGLIPVVPTGTEYQTVVTNEGNITDQVFYSDFFAAIAAVAAEINANDRAAEIKAVAEKAAAEKDAAEKAATAKAAAVEQAVVDKAAAEKAASRKVSISISLPRKSASKKTAE